MTKTYDINIWDRRSYETEGRETGGWVMNFYTYPQVGAHYGSGTYIEDLNLELTADEVKRLTLGWGKDLGGDYTPDDDFWIDTESFLDEYTDIPDRVREHINNLPEYEQIVEPFESSVRWTG